MPIITKATIIEKPFIHVDAVLAGSFIPLTTSIDLLDHELTAFFGATNKEIGRSIVENTTGFPIGAYYAQNICVTFDGCLFTDNALIAAASLNFRDSSRHVLAHFLQDELDEIDVQDPCVLLYGPGWTTWGHWTIEFLTRIYTMARMGVDKNTIKWVIPSECPAFARTLIQMIGINDENLITFDHTRQYLRCRSLVVPTNLTCGMSCHPLMTDYILWLRKTLGTDVAPDPTQRIYLSRQKLGSQRCVLNAGEVEDVMREHGYQVIYPEHMTIAEQITCYARSISMFSEYGSGSHNSIFASPHTFIGCLRDNKRSVGFVQSALCRAAGQKSCYVFGEQAPYDQSFRIDMNDLRDSLIFADSQTKRSIAQIYANTRI